MSCEQLFGAFTTHLLWKFIPQPDLKKKKKIAIVRLNLNKKDLKLMNNHLFPDRPSHFNPCRTRPKSISPQKSQNVGAL